MAVRIPRAYAEQAGLYDGCAIDLRARDGTLVLRKRPYTLDSLLAQVTDESLHGEADMGPPAGKEAW